MENHSEITHKFKLRRNFGHRPRFGLKGAVYSLFTWLFGISNLVKRQQMKDLFAVLNPGKEDVIMDFGCSSGYVSMELARNAKKVIGVDINECSSGIPRDIKNNIEFRQYDGDLENIPVSDSSCNKILISEVLQAIPDHTALFEKYYDLLKPGGELVILHGVGRPVIKKAYENNHRFLRIVSFFGGPKNYECYQRKLNEEFRSLTSEFIPVNDIEQRLTESKFKVTSVLNTPVDGVVIVLEWSQFVAKVLLGKSLHTNNPIFFLLVHPFCVLSKIFSKKRDLEYCVLIHAVKSK